MQKLWETAGAGSGQKAKDFLFYRMPHRLVEQNPQPEAIPVGLLLLRQGVYQLRQPQKEILQPGMLPAQPLWQGCSIRLLSGLLAQLRGRWLYI